MSVIKRLAFAYRQSGTVTANEKNSVTLNCLHIHGVPPIITVWAKDGVKINADKKKRFSLSNQVIELRDLGMEDAGNYGCIVKSQVSQIQNTVRLVVRFLPATCDRIRKSGQLKSGQYHIYPTGDQSHTMRVYCDMDSKPGEGVTVVFKTCSDIRKYGQLKSGQYQIYPMGDPSTSLQVYCDMDSKPGEGITVISHDSEARTRVPKGNGKATYKKTIIYGVTNSYIKAIIKNSRECKQFIKFECHGSWLTAIDSGTYNPSTWWVSAAGQKMKNWGGVSHTKEGCACSLTNSCAGGYVCNCNENDLTWREDSGYLDEKEFLPVKELVSGDTDDSGEDAYYTVGKLQCY